MSSLCLSLSHLLTSSLPQHEAPPGQDHLLQGDTLHRARLPEPVQSTSSASEPLSQINYESDGNPRNTSLTFRRSVEDYKKIINGDWAVVRALGFDFRICSWDLIQPLVIKLHETARRTVAKNKKQGQYLCPQPRRRSQKVEVGQKNSGGVGTRLV